MHRLPSPARRRDRSRRGQARARRLGSDPQRAGAVDPRDRPATRSPIAFTSTIGTRTEYPLISPSARIERLSAADQGDVATRPADIDGDQILDLGRAADLQATDDTGRGAGKEEPHRTLPGDGGGADAAAGLHDLKRRPNAVLRQTPAPSSRDNVRPPA